MLVRNKSSFVRREQQNPAESQGKGIKSQETLILVSQNSRSWRRFLQNPVEKALHELLQPENEWNTSVSQKHHLTPAGRAQDGNGGSGTFLFLGPKPAWHSWERHKQLQRQRTTPKTQPAQLQGLVASPEPFPRCFFPRGKRWDGQQQGE